MPDPLPGARADALRYSATREELLPFVAVGARRVLDVGCGTGGFGRSLRANRPQIHLTGVEPEAAAAATAREVYDDVVTGYFPADTTSLPRDYDTVLMLDVLEHMTDPEVALDGARLVLAEGGVLVASIPNVRHFDVWWPLVRHGRWTYTETGLMDRTHVRWFTRSSIRDMFESSGWEVLSLVGINRVDPVGWKAKLLARLGRGMDDMFFLQYAVTARPGERAVPGA